MDPVIFDAQTNSSLSVKRIGLSTHITCLKLFKSILLIGEGNQVILFDIKQGEVIGSEVIFAGSVIHGIRINDSETVLFFGAKSLKIFSYISETEGSSFSLQNITEEIHLSDWIHDVQFLYRKDLISQIISITAHNSLTFWSAEETEVKTIHCSENCILYSGNIIFHNAEVIILAVGTVFQQILLWSPNSLKEINNAKIPFHRLIGHQGVIFSVVFSETLSLICSTSDDRSLRLWKVSCNIAVSKLSLQFWENSCITLLNVLFSHESRVWMSAILKNCILSVGEDSVICFWDVNGELQTKKKCHKGGSVWCLESSINPYLTSESSEINGLDSYIAYTGGSDGGVYCWEVTDKFSERMIRQISFDFEPCENDFPRTAFILAQKEAEYLTSTTDKGRLSFYDLKLKSWINVYSDLYFQSYCVASVSFESEYIALGNMFGDLVVLKYKGCSLDKCNFKKFKIHDGKICSIHWVDKTSKHMLTCGLKGIILLWTVACVNDEFEIKLVRRFCLPKSKPHWWSTAALYTSDSTSLIVGDRAGSMILYIVPYIESADHEIESSMRLRCIHGENGVTDIQEHNAVIYSSGRDGRVIVYSVNKNSLSLLHSIKVPHNLEWIGKMVFYGKDLLLLGFHTKYFIAWSTQLESAVMDVECGGGHRSWDFHLSEDGRATFVAIKKKDIIHCEVDLQFVLRKSVIKVGISGKEFTNCCYLFTKTSGCMSVFACGGEDTTLRILGILDEQGNQGQIISLCNLSGHLSSIRSIAKTEMLKENTCLLVSVGGRAQMKIWSITNDKYLKCEHLTSYILSFMDSKGKKPWKVKQETQIDPQMRFMDVVVSLQNTDEKENYVIATACSDSFFRIFSYDALENKIALCYNVQHGVHCILKLKNIKMTYQSTVIRYFITGATDGRLQIICAESTTFLPPSADTVNLTKQLGSKVEFEVKLHKSGINAIDAKNVLGNIWLICTGGDDNALSAILLHFDTLSENAEISVIAQANYETAHASQITGIKIIGPEMLISSSIDQRLNVWKWQFQIGLLSLLPINSYLSIIPDIAHLECWEKRPSNWTAIVCGEGIECFNLIANNGNEENFHHLKTWQQNKCK